MSSSFPKFPPTRATTQCKPLSRGSNGKRIMSETLGGLSCHCVSACCNNSHAWVSQSTIECVTELWPGLSQPIAHACQRWVVTESVASLDQLTAYPYQPLSCHWVVTWLKGICGTGVKFIVVFGVTVWSPFCAAAHTKRKQHACVPCTRVRTCFQSCCVFIGANDCF